MTTEGRENHYLNFASALRELLTNPQLHERFLASDSSDEVRIQLNISKDVADEIKEILLLRREPVLSSQPEAGEPESQDTLRTGAISSVDSARKFLDSSFDQLRTGYRISLLMSVMIFFIGVAFLAVTIVRAVWYPEESRTTAIIGGLGVVQIVAVFYRNPLRDIQRAVSNSQQAKMTIMSYMLGVSLIGESVYGQKATTDEGRRLSEITKQAVEHLQHYVEPRASKARRPSDGASDPLLTAEAQIPEQIGLNATTQPSVSDSEG